jgi:superfamily II DNA or RNA helicase
MLSPSWADLEDAFHESTLARGVNYARGGRVADVRTEALSAMAVRVAANVQGTEPEPYEVAVTLQRGSREFVIDGRCTCPIGYNCKHAAAALIAAYRLLPTAPASRTEDRGMPAVAAPVAATSQVSPARVAAASAPALAHHGYWIERVRALYAPPAQTASPAVRKQRLAYAIEREPYGARPLVRPLIGNVRKDGALGSLRFAPDDIASILRNRPQYLGDEDEPVLRALALATDLSMYGGKVMARDAALLRRIVESGQAMAKRSERWNDYVPLRLAEPRTATGQWIADAQGRQRFALAVDPVAEALALEGLWYVDAQRGEFGSLQADVDAPLAAVLLAAPPIAPAEAAAVARELAAALPPAIARPPLPTPIETRAVGGRGVVHLRLACASVRTGSGYSPSVEIGAALFVHVRYGEVPVRLDDDGRPRMHGGALVAPSIDAALHKKTLNRLRSAGCEDMPGAPAQQPYECAFFLHESLVLRLMHDSIPHWRKSGWVIEIDPDFAWHAVPAGAFFIAPEAQDDDRWFGLELGVEVEGQRVSLYPLLARLLADRQLRDWLLAQDGRDTDTVNVRIDARRIAALPAARLRTILRALIELHDAPAAGEKLRLARTDAARLLELAEAGFEWRGGERLRALAERLKCFSAIEEVAPPRGLTTELRPYQRAGLAWLQFLRAHELAGILADDMGLGKTVQAIAHVLLEKEAGRLTQPALVVAPTSVVHNWQIECARFAPALKVLVLHGQARRAAFAEIGANDVVLTTYPLLPRDIETLAQQEFQVAIFDEAQNLKNARTRAAEAAARLRAATRLALTGTPLENNLGELWSQFNLLLPGFLGDSRRFAQLYRTPIEKRGDDARRAHLARRIRPFILRRTKDMVARELPPKTEIEQTVELAGAQRDLYETVRAAMHERVREALAKQGLARSHIVVLDALLKLRQVCCDPRLVRSDAAKKVRESAKLERLQELLPELVAEGRRVLLFSQFTSMLALIEQAVHALGITFVKLTGETKDRATPVARFQRGEVPLFLISLKAGGTGLNLTAADTVIHYDPWWNPAVENQATDRAHRIGQDKPVFVHRLIAAGTVEERIRELQARKAALARGILDEDAALAKVLTAEDLQALFEPLPT